MVWLLVSKQANSIYLTHTDPPAARAVRSSSRRSPSFPVLVRPARIDDGPPEINSLSNDLWITELAIVVQDEQLVKIFRHLCMWECMQRTKTYTERLIPRLTSSVTELVRVIWFPEPMLPEGSDSALTTWSKIKATACLKVAAAVLDQRFTWLGTTKLIKTLQISTQFNLLAHTVRRSVIFKEPEADTKCLRRIILRYRRQTVPWHYIRIQ